MCLECLTNPKSEKQGVHRHRNPQGFHEHISTEELNMVHAPAEYSLFQKLVKLSISLEWRIEDLWSCRRDYTITHIARDNNWRADALSKKGLSIPQGPWRMQITVDNISHGLFHTGYINFNILMVIWYVSVSKYFDFFEKFPYNFVS